MRITKILKLLALLALLSKSAFSTEFTEAHCELARKLLERTEAEESYINGLKEALDHQVQAVPQMQAFKSVISKWQDTYLTWDKFEDRYIEIICEAYSEDDINSLLDFYETPAGKKQLEKSDQITIEVMRFSELVAAQHQPELAIMINKRSKELEMEVETLFPEFKEEEALDEIIIHTATDFQNGSMQELVYTLRRSDAKDRSSIQKRGEDVTLSPIEAMKAAFEEHFSDIAVAEQDYWDDTSVTLSNFIIESDDLDSPEQRTLWYYSVSCSVFGNYPNFGSPADVVVLMDGTLVKPKKKI